MSSGMGRDATARRWTDTLQMAVVLAITLLLVLVALVAAVLALVEKVGPLSHDVDREVRAVATGNEIGRSVRCEKSRWLLEPRDRAR